MKRLANGIQPELDLAGGWTAETIVFQDSQVGAQRQSIQLWFPADADAVLEQQIQTGNEEDPFWCYLWPTARILAQQVFSIIRLAFSDLPASHSSRLQVLDTGCGIGLVGLAALAAGSTTVTFQDLRSLSVELALHNAQVNGFGDRAIGETFDWRSPPAQTFDWIIASDVLYHVPAHEPLLNFLERAIALPKSPRNTPPQRQRSNSTLAQLGITEKIWIGDPGRREAEAFIQRAKAHFQVHLFDAKGTPLASPQHGDYQLIVLNPIA